MADITKTTLCISHLVLPGRQERRCFGPILGVSLAVDLRPPLTTCFQIIAFPKTPVWLESIVPGAL